jgi:hypothetical protein
MTEIMMSQNVGAIARPTIPIKEKIRPIGRA